MRKLILILLLLSIHFVAYNQVITGTVFDNKTKTVIYSAAVYFNGTSVGTLSDEKGNFSLDITKDHLTMPLTISAIGYYSFTLNNFSTSKPNMVFLNPKLFELNEVSVNAKFHSLARSENLTIFRNEFLGTTSNSMNCKILNEDDIRFKFSENRDTLKAFSTKPLLIENRALGYKVTYYLDKFDFDNVSKSFIFNGNVIFKEDTTITSSKKSYYERKRKNTYRGSRMHFFRALWTNDLNPEGFTVRNSAYENVTFRDIVVQKDGNKKYLRYRGDLGISYLTKQATSSLIFLKESVYFDANGYFEPNGIIWQGEIARQRIADQLPYEYSVNN
jgi:hypothetical protein